MIGEELNVRCLKPEARRAGQKRFSLVIQTDTTDRWVTGGAVIKHDDARGLSWHRRPPAPNTPSATLNRIR
jgi:hypothetical protein